MDTDSLGLVRPWSQDWWAVAQQLIPAVHPPWLLECFGIGEPPAPLLHIPLQARVSSTIFVNYLLHEVFQDECSVSNLFLLHLRSFHNDVEIVASV